MRLILMLLVLGWSTTFVVAQDAYFQQWVNMEIKVQLDDEKHQLNGWWSMKYENRSPDTLTFIYMHLWPNAYQDRTTAFAQQMLRSGDTEEGFSGSIGLNATFTSGNILFADFGTASHIEWRKNKDTK